MSDLNLNILPRTFDPIQLEQQARYRTLGLTYISNNDSIIPRDAAGNIIMQEGSDTNPLLIIDPVTEQITTKSALRVLDTAFQYYKFPVSIAVTSSLPNLDLTIETSDPVYARYRPSQARVILNGTPGAVDDASKFSGILMDFVEDGISQKAVNNYQITKEIKESGIDLRFRFKIEHRYDSPEVQFGNAYFSIIKNSPTAGLLRLFKGPFANQSILPNNYWGSIGQYEVQTLNVDIIIQNNEFEIGDYFGIGATADPQTDSSFHTINAVQSYWVITDASKNVDEWNQEI